MTQEQLDTLKRSEEILEDAIITKEYFDLVKKYNLYDITPAWKIPLEVYKIMRKNKE